MCNFSIDLLTSQQTNESRLTNKSKINKLFNLSIALLTPQQANNRKIKKELISMHACTASSKQYWALGHKIIQAIHSLAYVAYIVSYMHEAR